MRIRHYQDMKVWQRAVDLALACYDCTEAFPPWERFGLSSQIQRAAVSISCNIAEGQGRDHEKEFIHHLSIARGSLQELETLLIIAERRAYASAETLGNIREWAGHVGRMLAGLKRALIKSSAKPLAARH